MIAGIEGYRCGCLTWMEHWRKFSGNTQESCAVPNCQDKILLGTLVQKVSAYDHRWYVVPICVRHRTKEAQINVREDATLVIADSLFACEVNF